MGRVSSSGLTREVREGQNLREAGPSSIHGRSFHRPPLNPPLLVTWGRDTEKKRSGVRVTQFQEHLVVYSGQKTMPCLFIFEINITPQIRHIMSLKPL